MKKVLKFILASIITILLGLWLGWFLAKSNLPINIMNHFITPILESRQIQINIGNIPVSPRNKDTNKPSKEPSYKSLNDK